MIPRISPTRSILTWELEKDKPAEAEIVRRVREKGAKVVGYSTDISARMLNNWCRGKRGHIGMSHHLVLRVLANLKMEYVLTANTLEVKGEEDVYAGGV